MRAPGLVDDQRHAARRGRPRRARRRRRRRRSRSGRRRSRRPRRARRPAPLERLGGQAVGDPELVVELGRDEARPQPGEHQPVDRRGVDVALDDDPLAEVGERQADRVVAAGAAVDQEPAAPRAPGLGGESLGASERRRVRSGPTSIPSIPAGMSSASARSPNASLSAGSAPGPPLWPGDVEARRVARRRTRRARRGTASASWSIGRTLPARARTRLEHAALALVAATVWRVLHGRRPPSKYHGRICVARPEQLTALVLVLLSCSCSSTGCSSRPSSRSCARASGRIEALAKEGEAGAERGPRAARDDRRVARRLPGRDHDGLDRHRLPRRARDRAADRARARRRHRRAPSISFAIAFLIATSLHITIGEQVPKMLAITRAERAARMLARPLHWFRGRSAPRSPIALNEISNAIVRLFGVDPARPRARSTRRTTSRRSSRPRPRAARSTPARR